MIGVMPLFFLIVHPVLSHGTLLRIKEWQPDRLLNQDWESVDTPGYVALKRHYLLPVGAKTFAMDNQSILILILEVAGLEGIFVAVL